MIAIAAFAVTLAAAADDVPAWLKDAAAASLPTYDRKVSTVVLFNEEQTVVSDAGRLTTTTRTAIKFLTRVGADATFFEQYDTGSGKVRDFRAWMISPSGKVKKYGKDEILDVACAANDVYNECRRRAVSGKNDADTGAVFAYEATVERQAFVPQLVFYYQDTSPVRLARFSVTLPPGWELKASSFNGAPAERPPSGNVYSWQMENVAPIDPESASPGVSSLAPWTGVSLAGKGGRPVLSWTDAARTLAELNQGVAEPNEAMSAKAKSLVQGLTTDLDKIRAIGKFVQGTNYVSIQVNIGKGGGYRPRPAPLVFQRLYGDCKDKANLVRAMLKAIGMEAYPVAIYAGDRTHVRREWASLGSFNHAISAIKVGADTKAAAVLEHPRLGRLLLFDSTDPYTPAGRLPDHEQASLALIGAPEGDLIEVPAAPADAADRKREIDATLGADGSLSGMFVDRRTGETLAPVVSHFRSAGQTEYLKAVERWVGRGVPGAATSALVVADEDGAFTLKGNFKTVAYAQQPQPTMLIFRAAPLRHDVVRLTEKTRKHPVVLDADALTETVRVSIPAGYRVDELPPPVSLKSPFGTFEAKWSLNGGTVTFQRKVEVQAQSVPAAKYGELRKFLDVVGGAPESPVVLVK
jgi:hypothetical protein